ncbi:MAG: patatin [Dasosvirus sp.]|uniref:Patatin n=1 Tax=Dasosvirus sp. TaxID=2487764 RepID=A0A3G4ZRP1_9VIRU|nr:MAG: patatin [Dasosvirus sp.]
MDIISKYFTKVTRDIKENKVIDNYKIITVNDIDKTKPFLLFCHDNLVLTSQSLIKLLMIKRLDCKLFNKLLNENSPKMNVIFNEIVDISAILSEDKIFFDFDPYNNFILSNNSSNECTTSIIQETLGLDKSGSGSGSGLVSSDFSKIVNPYGLEKVVFAGGGSKGTIYIGTIIGLFAVGQIFYINHFSGTSIGALTALVMGTITPSKKEYDDIRTMVLRDIITKKSDIVEKYQKAIRFFVDIVTRNPIETFYKEPLFNMYGIWTIIDKVINDKGLYDPVKSGFIMWYAMLCKKISYIMGNSLDDLIIIRKKDGTYVEPNDTESDEEYLGNTYDGWKLERFFTFREYNALTGKRLVLTGTKTNCIDVVYYQDTDPAYCDLNVLTGAMASTSIPGLFKAPIINGSYNLDGGLYDNYPLTHCDKKIKDKVIGYNNRIFGYLFDDKNSMIDTYEIIREAWLAYDGFLEVINIIYLKDSSQYLKISELFFEIRLELFKLLYCPETDIRAFLNLHVEPIKTHIYSIIDLAEIFDELMLHSEYMDQMDFCLPKLGIEYVKHSLEQLETSCIDNFKIGKKTSFTELMDITVKHGTVFNTLVQYIKKDQQIISSLTVKMKIVQQYENILDYLMQRILAYYELKGVFILTNDLERYSKYFSEIIKTLYEKLKEFQNICDKAYNELNLNNLKITKNYIQQSIGIAMTMVYEILTRGSNNDINPAEIETNSNKYWYLKILDYIYHTDISAILCKYTYKANDRICNDTFNKMRTIKLNTFETSILHFNMDDNLKCRLIFEGYYKTVKYFVSLLNIMERTGKCRSTDEYIDSYEQRYKKVIQKL